MDGFALGEYGPIYAYSHFGRRDIPNYFAWAEDFVLNDNTFASVAGPSFPNHLFFIAGQAGGAIDNPENILTKRLNDGRVFKSWGCDAYGENVYVWVEDDRGQLKEHSTCFRFRTVEEQLSGIGRFARIGILERCHLDSLKWPSSSALTKQRAHQIAEDRGASPLRSPRTPAAECGAGTRCRRGQSAGGQRSPGASCSAPKGQSAFSCTICSRTGADRRSRWPGCRRRRSHPQRR
jgi:Phosphoesterase family